MTIEDIVDRFCESRSEMYRLLFNNLAKAVVERCAQTAEATEGLAHEVLVDGKTETVTCGCGTRIAAVLRAAA